MFIKSLNDLLKIYKLITPRLIGFWIVLRSSAKNALSIMQSWLQLKSWTIRLDHFLRALFLLCFQMLLASVLMLASVMIILLMLMIGLISIIARKNIFPLTSITLMSLLKEVLLEKPSTLPLQALVLGNLFLCAIVLLIT